jgi:sulfoxide reductase heme-binding subunit YedZ
VTVGPAGSLAAVTVGPSVDWYLTRASGTVALILLTASMVIGVAAIARLRGPGVPRFVVDGIHRTASLLAVVFLGVHIVTAVLDSFAPISLLDAVIPFIGSYRPLWLGLGAVAFDLMLAVAITSLVRDRMGHATWRGVHWLAYATWPLAVLHGFGTGSDVHQGWLQAIDVACILVVLAAVAGRVMIGWPENFRLRVGALAMSAMFAGGLAVWLPGGPLGKGWARRAGTPAALLGHHSARGRGS